MALSLVQSFQCSSCKRPWQPLLYKTCDACRQKGHHHWRRHHPLAVAEAPGSTSLQSIGHSVDLISSQRTLCTQCYRPWQSPRYKTCDGCRQSCRQKYRGRLISATATETVSSGPSDTARDGFSGPASSGANATRRLHPLPQPRAKRQRIIDPQTSNDSLDKALGFLHYEYERHAVATQSFPPEITPSDIRKSISKYEEMTSNASKRSVCASCGKLVPEADIFPVDDGDPLLLPLGDALDRCAQRERTWDVCLPCHKALIRGTIPKFSARNLVNVTLCQDYPSVLDDLTLTEECVIAKCHPLGVIVKLRPGGRRSSISYRALRGHFIVIPQDPGPLLQILPSPQLKLDELIKVFWLEDRPPTYEDLSPFLVIRRVRVLAALQYLVRNNHLYQSLTIDQSTIDDWSDEFIPPELEDNIIRLDQSDHQEREGYTVNLGQGNYENDLQAAQSESVDSNDFGLFLTGSVSTDINGERQNSDLRMLHTLVDVVGSRSQERPNPVQECPTAGQRAPVVSYRTRGQVALMNHWSDPYYFTAAFPTLFPMGVGGHLDERNIPVSLSALAEWALSHHSRR